MADFTNIHLWTVTTVIGGDSDNSASGRGFSPASPFETKDKQNVSGNGLDHSSSCCKAKKSGPCSLTGKSNALFYDSRKIFLQETLKLFTVQTCRYPRRVIAQSLFLLMAMPRVALRASSFQ